MSSVPAPAQAYRFGRPEPKGVLVGLRLAQVIILGVAAALAVTAMVTIPSGAGLGLALAVVALAAPVALARVRGRCLDQWVPVVARWAVLVALGRRRWRSTLPQLGLTPASEWAEPPPPLAATALLRVRRAGTTNAVAVVRDIQARSFTAVVACRSRPFALLDPAEQDRLIAQWGGALASVAQEGSPVTRIAWVERTLPADGDALVAHLDDHGDTAPGHGARDSYAQLVAIAGPTTQAHECYVALSIGGSRARRAIAQAGGGDRGAGEVLLRELSSLTDRLRQAEVDVDEVLGPRRLAGVLRGAFDPACLRPMALRGRRHPASSGAAGPSAWPLATEVSWDHYRTDSGLHATYWMAELPRRDVQAAFLFPLLLRTTAMRAIAVVAEPIPPSAAARAVEAAHASHVADEELRAKAGYLPSARRRRQHDDILSREAEMAAGHAEYRFSGYVTVSATDLDGLERAAGEVEHLGFDAGVELRRLYGEQDSAFTYTLPLARGLR